VRPRALTVFAWFLLYGVIGERNLSLTFYLCKLRSGGGVK
jgi:hypothetical protein